jgi:hypothetical protein
MLYFRLITSEEYLHNNARHGKASYWSRGRHRVVAHTLGEGVLQRDTVCIWQPLYTGTLVSQQTAEIRVSIYYCYYYFSFYT